MEPWPRSSSWTSSGRGLNITQTFCSKIKISLLNLLKLIVFKKYWYIPVSVISDADPDYGRQISPKIYPKVRTL